MYLLGAVHLISRLWEDWGAFVCCNAAVVAMAEEMKRSWG